MAQRHSLRCEIVGSGRGATRLLREYERSKGRTPHGCVSCHWVPTYSGGKTRVTIVTCEDRAVPTDGRTALDPPRRLASGVGQIGAEVTGANASAQVIAQLRMTAPDPLEAPPDALADRTARTLGLRR